MADSKTCKEERRRIGRGAAGAKLGMEEQRELNMSRTEHEVQHNDFGSAFQEFPSTDKLSCRKKAISEQQQSRLA